MKKTAFFRQSIEYLQCDGILSKSRHATEGGRQKKSVLSEDSNTMERRGVKEKESRTGKRIPACHVSFLSDESRVLSRNDWVQLLLAAKINSLKNAH